MSDPGTEPVGGSEYSHEEPLTADALQHLLHDETFVQRLRDLGVWDSLQAAALEHKNIEVDAVVAAVPQAEANEDELPQEQTLSKASDGSETPLEPDFRELVPYVSTHPIAFRFGSVFGSSVTGNVLMQAVLGISALDSSS